MVDKLAESLTKESDTWNEIKNGFHDILSSHVKSAESNITIYKEFAGKLMEQSMKIEKSYHELRELVIYFL